MVLARLGFLYSPCQNSVFHTSECCGLWQWDRHPFSTAYLVSQVKQLLQLLSMISYFFGMTINRSINENVRDSGRHPTNFTGISSECSPGLGWWGHGGGNYSVGEWLGSFWLLGFVCLKAPEKVASVPLGCCPASVVLFFLILSCLWSQPHSLWQLEVKENFFSPVVKFQNVHV